MSPAPFAKDRYQEKRKKMAYVVIEVARATNDGRIPVTQKQLQLLVRSQWKVRIPPSTLSGYVDELVESRSRPWLKKHGQEVELADEECTLIDSRAIRALYIARELIDEENERFSVSNWIQKCQERFALDENDCRELLRYYRQCRYLDESGSDSESERLNLRVFNEDEFYLNLAKNANLRRRGRRRISS